MAEISNFWLRFTMASPLAQAIALLAVAVGAWGCFRFGQAIVRIVQQVREARR